MQRHLLLASYNSHLSVTPTIAFACNQKSVFSIQSVVPNEEEAVVLNNLTQALLAFVEEPEFNLTVILDNLTSIGTCNMIRVLQ